MIDKIKRAVSLYNMFDTDGVTVALSGGADSVALLYQMKELKKEYGFSLSAAHLNHNLRGVESDRDEEFCKVLCKKLNIPLTVESQNINEISKNTGESTETCARRVRYEFLTRVSSGKIATAHTADDNLETVIFNLARGTDISGLAGIPPVRDNIIRPLIFCTREEIEEYLREVGSEYCTDSTNNEDIYSRNFIRHNIVPALEKLNPQVKATVSNMCEGLREEKEYISKKAAELAKNSKCGSGYDIKPLVNSQKGIAKNALMEIVKKETGILPDRKTLDKIHEIVTKGEGKLNFSGNNFLTVSHNLLEFNIIPSDYEIRFDVENLPENIGEFHLLKMDKEKFQEYKNVHKKLPFTALDCDKLMVGAVIRSRREGDFITPVGRKCSKTLKKLYNEEKIPLGIRNELPILADSEGVAAVIGLTVSERVRIDENTKNILVFENTGG